VENNVRVETFEVIRPTDEMLQALNPKSRAQWDSDLLMQDEILRKSSHIWELWIFGIPACVIGLLPFSLMGSGHRVWFLAAKGLKLYPITVVKFVRDEIMNRQLSNLSAVIEVTEYSAKKFARVLGFTETGQVQKFPQGDFEVFRLHGGAH